MSGISDQKKALRTQLLAKRQVLTSHQWRTKSKAIKEFLFESTSYIKAKTIHCFVSMNERKEVNTLPILEKMLVDGKKVIIPVTNFENGELEHSFFLGQDTLSPNKWGVLEPLEQDRVEPTTIDLILVPLLAVDNYGNRLGYGKGFYDRFLNQTNALKLGLLFQDFVLPQIPVDHFDEQLDGFITENGVRYLQQ